MMMLTIPAGICTIEYNESRPFMVDVFIGTPGNYNGENELNSIISNNITYNRQTS